MNRWRAGLIGLTLIAVAATSAAGQPEGKQTPRSNSPEEVMAYVARGADLILRLGPEAAFSRFMDPDSLWVEGDWYLYIGDFKGFVHAHITRQLVGKTVLHIPDSKGKYFYAELQRIGMSTIGRGWTKYWWPGVGSTEPKLKTGYVMRVPGLEYWIGAGIYGFSEERIDRLIEKYNQIIRSQAGAND